MSDQDLAQYEVVPGMDMDEVDRSLRYHFTQMSDEKLAEYDPSWSDEQIQEWDGNFRNDGCLFLVCCERDVDVYEYRQVIAEHIERRRKNGAQI